MKYTPGSPVFQAPWTILRNTSRDRKSTRLNSSHSQISYAVFCLKKKKSAHERFSHFRTTRGRCLLVREHLRFSCLPPVLAARRPCPQAPRRHAVLPV